MEGRMAAMARREALRARPSGPAWADMEDSDEEAEEYEEPEGFWGNPDQHDERAHYVGVYWTKSWGDHDPDAENLYLRELAVSSKESEAKKADRPSDAFPKGCQNQSTYTLNQTPGIKKMVENFLFSLPVSENGVEKKTVIPRCSRKVVRDDGTVEAILSDEYTFLIRRMEVQNQRTILLAKDGVFHWFECSPEEPGTMSDIVVTHFVEANPGPAQSIVVTEPSLEARSWWTEIVESTPYFGDVGGSEKVETSLRVTRRRENSRNFTGTPLTKDLTMFFLIASCVVSQSQLMMLRPHLTGISLRRDVSRIWKWH